MTPRRTRAAKPIRVMLVDDHPLWRSTLRKVLEHRRFATIVGEAEDGGEAVLIAQSTSPEVVVMDIDLPQVNGIEATRRLSTARPDVKVLVLAASNDRAQVLRAVEAGASGYLLKRAGPDEVKEAVRRVHTGELAFPASLASVVLAELRRSPEPARSSDAGSKARHVFRREGDYWTVRYEDAVFRLKDTRGVRYLAQLLYEPSREFHALDLVSVDRGPTPALAGDAGPVLDPQAKAAYKRRLHDLQEELDEAAGWGDRERESRARREMEAITGEIAGAVGLGGRDRRAASVSERARVNVTLAIKGTLTKIRAHAPDLAEHLATTIRTGTFCSYTPDPRAPITWQRA
jgi:DNA-binding NarL/FixJ family response regulator